MLGTGAFRWVEKEILSRWLLPVIAAAIAVTW